MPKLQPPPDAKFKFEVAEATQFFPSMYEDKKQQDEDDEETAAPSEREEVERALMATVPPEQRRRIAAVMKKLQKLDEAPQVDPGPSRT